MAVSPDDIAAAQCRPAGPGRRHKHMFVVRERRSGFDRRRNACMSPVAAAFEAPLLRLHERPRRLAELLILINVLSAVDLLITLTVLRMGAVEVNPIMARLLEFGPAPAALAKIGIVVLATLGLWLLRRYRPALTTAVVLVAIYGTLVTAEVVALVWRVV